MKRFQDMSPEELQVEIDRLSQENERLKLIGETVHQPIIEQRLYLAKSYFLDPQDYPINQFYRVEGYEGRFELKYFKGAMAWGSWEGSWEEVAFPLARLQKIVKNK